MLRVFITAKKEVAEISELHSGLTRMGFVCSVADTGSNFSEELINQVYDVLFVDIDGASAQTESILGQLGKLRMTGHLPVIALVSDKGLGHLDSNLAIDDFVVKPWNLAEVVARARRAVKHAKNVQNNDLIKCGDLMLDVAKCEVSVGGRLLALTFKEYELLKFLAKKRGRVFTREALLNAVWGYDYYGGDRTVDVHIKRLRSKLGNSTSVYIQTVRNIGYKLSTEV
ncbi:MAG: response regulator transcription factor [Chloroflexi bacterium]|nr:response regulator transcription factor [Chloroflexota bacterium]